MDIGHTYTLQHQLDIKHTYNHSSASEQIPDTLQCLTGHWTYLHSSKSKWILGTLIHFKIWHDTGHPLTITVQSQHGYWAHLYTSTSGWTLDTLTITVQSLKLILGTLIHFKIWLDIGHSYNHSTKSKWILGTFIHFNVRLDIGHTYNHSSKSKWILGTLIHFNVWLGTLIITVQSLKLILGTLIHFNVWLDTLIITVQSLKLILGTLIHFNVWLDTLIITVQSLKLILGTLIHFNVWLDTGHTYNHSSKSKWILGTLIHFNVWLDVGHTYNHNSMSEWILGTLIHFNVWLDPVPTYNHSSKSKWILGTLYTSTSDWTLDTLTITVQCLNRHCMGTLNLIITLQSRSGHCALLYWSLLLYVGKRRYDRKQSGYGGQTKVIFRKKVLELQSITFCYINVCSKL